MYSNLSWEMKKEVFKLPWFLYEVQMNERMILYTIHTAMSLAVYKFYDLARYQRIKVVLFVHAWLCLPWNRRDFCRLSAQTAFG